MKAARSACGVGGAPHSAGCAARRGDESRQDPLASSSVARTPDEMAVLVKQALAAEDVSAYADLLDPDVTWGAPGARTPTCGNRKQVLDWFQRGRDAGVQGSIYDVEVLGDRLLVSMSVRGTGEAQERGGIALRFQVLTVRNGKIVDIVGFDDKAEALSYVS